jgi:transposase InsO family protein
MTNPIPNPIPRNIIELLRVSTDLQDVARQRTDLERLKKKFNLNAHDRRRILHFGVTAHPTAEWTAQQLCEAFTWETGPRYLLRDRGRIFGPDFVTQVKAMGIQQMLSPPRSPWQRAYVERAIGTIRRECLDPVIVFSEAGLSRHLRRFADYYHRSRTHLGLQKDTLESRPAQPPGAGRIVAIPEVGGLHHRYERRAA